MIQEAVLGERGLRWQRRFFVELHYCAACGKPFQRSRRFNDACKYCSPACARSLIGLAFSNRPCARCGEPFTPTGSGSRECAACKGGLRCPVYFPLCEECGALFTARGKTAKCCKPCLPERARRGMRDIYRKPPEPVRKTCAFCRAEFVDRPAAYIAGKRRAARTAFCSDACSKHAAKQRRRMRERAAFVEYVSLTVLMKRDGGVCQLCHKRVGNNAVPAPLAPTIDHIVPLAAGGLHEYRNVQLAHFACNSLRGAAGAAQLRLTE